MPTPMPCDVAMTIESFATHALLSCDPAFPKEDYELATSGNTERLCFLSLKSFCKMHPSHRPRDNLIARRGFRFIFRLVACSFCTRLIIRDECSVFGIATKPLYSRCYNSSPYLRMRRAYNGVLYDRGRQLPGSHNMPKVHPGDVLRCEVDMDEGTLRFR